LIRHSGIFIRHFHPMLPQRLLDAAEIVREAAVLVREIQQTLVTPALEKSDRSPVTVADFASQAVVAARLKARWPGEPLVGEEDARDLRTPENAAQLAQVAAFVGRRLPEMNEQNVCDWIDEGAADPADAFWTLDPIDGTKGFLRGDQYAVALAFIVGGRVELAVLGCPKLARARAPERGGPGSLVVAARGQGAWTAPLVDDSGTPPWRQLAVSHEADPARAHVLRSVESGHTDKGKAGELSHAFGSQAEPIGMDSQAKYAVLAAGGAELLVRLISPGRPDYKEKIWDQAAGSLVIEEAGGRVTDLDGNPLDFSHGRTLAVNRGVLATNGHLHDAALAALRAVRA
jgi:3'(2'), 5'-bisphosphate nucleotidase